MTSNHFYSLTDQALKPEFERQGFSRAKTTSSLWTKKLSENTGVFELAKGGKNPYLPHFGGRFAVNFYLAPSAQAKDRKPANAVALLEIFDESDLAEIKRIRDGVLNKIIHQKGIKDAATHKLLESRVPVYRLEAKRPLTSQSLQVLPYLDDEDVLEWSQFFAGRLDRILSGVSEAVPA